MEGDAVSISDPLDPNYFRLDDIVKIRGLLAELRAWIEDAGAYTELVEITNELIRAAWPASQSGFDPAFEADRAFIRQLGVDPR
jgi:hypothetical protein